MTTEEYLAALRKLELRPHAKETADELCRSRRQCQRYAEGAAIPEPVARHLRRLLERRKAAAVPR